MVSSAFNNFLTPCNKHEKSSRSPGPSSEFVAEAKLNNIVYTVYTWQAVCTVQLINTWCQAGISKGFVDYSENGGHQTNIREE